MTATAESVRCRALYHDPTGAALVAVLAITKADGTYAIRVRNVTAGCTVSEHERPTETDALAFWVYSCQRLADLGYTNA